MRKLTNAAQVAKLIKQQAKELGLKVTAKSQNFSMGNSVSVHILSGTSEKSFSGRHNFFKIKYPLSSKNLFRVQEDPRLLISSSNTLSSVHFGIGIISTLVLRPNPQLIFSPHFLLFELDVEFLNRII